MNSKEASKKNKKRKNKNKGGQNANTPTPNEASNATSNALVEASSSAGLPGQKSSAKEKSSDAGGYGDILKLMNEMVEKEPDFTRFDQSKLKIEAGLAGISHIIDKFDSNNFEDFPEVDVGKKPVLPKRGI